MNINYRGQTIDIRQPNPCDNCGHVAETVPFEGKELCDGCARPMTLERIKASLAMEEVTAVCVHKQYEFKEWYGPAIAFVDRLMTCDHTNVEVTDFEGIECCEKCQPERLFPVAA